MFNYCLIYLQVRNEGHLMEDSAILNINRMFLKTWKSLQTRKWKSFLLSLFYCQSYMESRTVYEIVIFSTLINIRHSISFKVLWRHQVVEWLIIFLFCFFDCYVKCFVWLTLQYESIELLEWVIINCVIFLIQTQLIWLILVDHCI